MKLFDRYLLSQFFKIFLTLEIASLLLVIVYAVTDFLLAFKVSDTKVVFLYTLYLLPTSFYILSPVVFNLSALVFFRRLLAKNVDLTAQSFTLSPLRLSMPVAIVGFLMGGLFLFMNESLLPTLFKKLWYIEKVFKKKQEVGRIVSQLWFLKKTQTGKYFVYIGNLDVRTGRFTNLFILTVSHRGKIEEVVEGISGRWEGKNIFVNSGKAYDFRRGYFAEELRNLSLKTEIDLSEVGIFAEKITHVRMSALLSLYMKGSLLGLDVNRYLSEVLYRVGMSFLPVVVFLLITERVLRGRNFKKGFLYLFLYLGVGWFVASSPKVLADKANLQPQYALIFYVLLLSYLLKRVYDLHKGFRL